MTSYESLRTRGPAAFAEETGRTRYWHVLTEARLRLVDPVTGRARAELVEDVACAVCNEDRPYGGFLKDGFRYVRCSECGTVYISPQLREEAMLEFWRTSNVASAWVDVLNHPAQHEYDTKKFEQALDDLDAAGISGGRLLDFGCSAGAFLEIARSRGYEVTGVEPGERARDVAVNSRGLDVVPTLDDLHPGRSFDVITSWEVLEHTKRPGQYLGALRARCAPGGRLIVLVGGNAASLANRIMRHASAAFDFARNWYFTPSSFRQLLERSGWEQTSEHQLLDEIDVVNSYLGYGDPYQPPGYTEEILPPDVGDRLRAMALGNGMGYKFRVVAAPTE